MLSQLEGRSPTRFLGLHRQVPLFELGEHVCNPSPVQPSPVKVAASQSLSIRPPPANVPSEIDAISPGFMQPQPSPLPTEPLEPEESPLNTDFPEPPSRNLDSPAGLRRRTSARSNADGEGSPEQKSPSSLRRGHGNSNQSSISSKREIKPKSLAEMDQDQSDGGEEAGFVTLVQRR